MEKEIFVRRDSRKTRPLRFIGSLISAYLIDRAECKFMSHVDISRSLLSRLFEVLSLTFFRRFALARACHNVFHPGRKRALGAPSVRNYGGYDDGSAIDAFWEEKAIELEKYFGESPKESTERGIVRDSQPSRVLHERNEREIFGEITFSGERNVFWKRNIKAINTRKGLYK